MSGRNSIAFIDGQNLYMGTRTGNDPWTVDLFRFRRYLKEKYSVERAYYFLGFMNEERQDLYGKIQEAGFILVFKQHNPAMQGEKKGNVDTDIVFTAMRKLYKREDFDRILLVSGDGDYKILVDFLIEENRFEKILFPNRRFASSLYRRLPTRFYDYLESTDIRSKICRVNKNKEGSP